MNAPGIDKPRQAVWALIGALAGLLLLAPLVGKDAPGTAWAVPAARASSAGSLVWAIECVECPRQFAEMTDRSLRLDAAGHPHVAYGEDHLYYAWHDGTTWYYETADSSTLVGWYVSLALDTAGHPHISYSDFLNGDLKYAYRDGSGWHTETVDSAGDVGRYTSLALDSAGHPDISYTDYTYRDLKYAYRDGSGWHIQTVDSAGDVGRYTSLALDSTGHPHISYLDLTNYDLKYAYRDGSGWHIQTVDGTAWVVSTPPWPWTVPATRISVTMTKITAA